MEKVAPNSKFVGHSTDIIRQSKIRAPLPNVIRQCGLPQFWNALKNLTPDEEPVATNGFGKKFAFARIFYARKSHLHILSIFEAGKLNWNVFLRNGITF